jgi:YVTN family beta-propeller protein
MREDGGMKALLRLLLTSLLLTSLLTTLGVSTLALADSPAYSLADHWPIGGDGGWDYLTVDSAQRVLYVARATHVVVVDLGSGKDIGDIPDTAGVHGIALAPELNRGFISCGRANVVKVFDLHSHAVLASIATGDGPDAILYEPVTQRVFVFNGRGHSATVIDAHSNAVVATIPLGGKPEEGRADGAGAVFANIEDKAELVRFDAHAASLTARWSLPRCEEPSGFELDPVHRRGFSTCGNALLAVTDLDSGKSVASVPIGKGVDGCAFDPATQTIFSSNGEGSLSVVREVTPDRYTVVQTLTTERGARTLALDRQTHRLYLPTAQFGPPASAGADARPTILPGTFEILVVQAR